MIENLENRLKASQFALENLSSIVSGNELGTSDFPPFSVGKESKGFARLNINNPKNYALEPLEQLKRIRQVGLIKDKAASAIALLEEHQQLIKLKISKNLLEDIEALSQKGRISSDLLTRAREIACSFEQKPQIITPKPERKLDLNKFPKVTSFLEGSSQKVKSLILQFLETPQSYEIAKIIKNFKETEQQNTDSFIGNLVGRVFEELAFIDLKSKYKKTRTHLLSPEQAYDLYCQIHLGKLLANNHSLNFGIVGITLGDIYEIEETDDDLQIKEIFEVKCVQEPNPEVIKRLEIQTTYLKPPKLNKGLKLVGKDQMDPLEIGKLVHGIIPTLGEKPLKIAEDLKFYLVTPEGSNLKIKGIQNKSVPLTTTDLNGFLFALLVDITGEQSPLTLQFLQPRNSKQEISISKPNQPVKVNGASVIESEEIIIASFTSPESAHLQIDPKILQELDIIPGVDYEIKEIWKRVLGKKLPEVVSWNRVRQKFPELNSPLTDSAIARLGLSHIPKDEDWDLSSIVAILAVKKFGFTLSKEASSALILKAIQLKPTPK